MISYPGSRNGIVPSNRTSLTSGAPPSHELEVRGDADIYWCGVSPAAAIEVVAGRGREDLRAIMK